MSLQFSEGIHVFVVVLILESWSYETDFCLEYHNLSFKGMHRVGEEISLNCTCDPPCRAEDIVFESVNSKVPSFPRPKGDVRLVSSSTAEFRLRFSSTNDSGLYRCCYASCNTSHVLRETSVVVEEPPLGPIWHDCWTSDLRHVECRWRYTGPHNTGLQYAIYVSAADGTQNDTRWEWLQPKSQAASSSGKDRIDMAELFPNSGVGNYRVLLCVRNVAGCKCLENILGTLAEIMRPTSVRDLHVSVVSSRRAEVTWSPPDHMPLSIYRVKFTAHNSTDTQSALVRDYTMRMSSLEPFTRYRVTVKARLITNGAEAGEWGEAAVASIVTFKDVPSRPPRVSAAMYSRGRCPQSRTEECIMVFWQPIPESAYHDFNVSYFLTTTGLDEKVDKATDSLHFIFGLPRSLTKDVLIKIYAVNSVGRSQKSGFISIPSNPAIPPPTYVKVTSQNVSKAEVTWEGMGRYNKSIFWCVRGVGTPCTEGLEGQLRSTTASPGVYKATVALSSPFSHSFAVATLGYDVTGDIISSGIVWADDTDGPSVSSSPESKGVDVWIILLPVIGAVLLTSLLIWFGCKIYKNLREEKELIPVPSLPSIPNEQPFEAPDMVYALVSFNSCTEVLSLSNTGSQEHIFDTSSITLGDMSELLEFSTSGCESGSGSSYRRDSPSRERETFSFETEPSGETINLIETDYTFQDSLESVR